MLVRKIIRKLHSKFAIVAQKWVGEVGAYLVRAVTGVVYAVFHHNPREHGIDSDDIAWLQGKRAICCYSSTLPSSVKVAMPHTGKIHLRRRRDTFSFYKVDYIVQI